jgi:hypothetical protein
MLAGMSAEDVADRLSSLSEEVADMAMTELRAAMERGETKRPDAERLLTRARHAIEKAEQILRQVSEDDPDS